jgi:hypothetical protein
MFLDGATFDTGVSQGFVGAQNQSVLFPPAYPSMDAMSLNQRADPYNPQTNGSLVRYPTLTGFDRAELDYARVQFQLLASPLPPAAADKFYNIRGTRTENDDQTPISDTAGNVTWDWIQPTFDARDPSPIHDDAAVPGDDTQPEWTTHLASNDPARCITVLGHDIEHIFMMSHAGVLQEIQAILCRPVPQGGAVDPGDTPLPEPASDTDVEEFIRWCLENREFIRTLPPFSDPRVRRAKIPKRFGKLLPGIARRFIADVMKRPGPPGLGGPPRKPRGGKPRGPDGKSPKAPARRPPTRKRSGSASARRTGKKKQR